MTLSDSIVPSDRCAHFWKRRASIFFSKSDLSLPTRKHKHTSPLSRSEKNTVTTIVHHLWRQTPNAITILPRSTLHRVFKITVRAKEYILRLNAQPEQYIECQFYIDEWIAKTLRLRHLPTPAIYRVDTSRTICSTDYEVMEAAPGSSLYELSQTRKLTHSILVNLGKFIAKIHSIPIRGYGPLMMTGRRDQAYVKGMLSSWHDYFFMQLNRHVNVCRTYGLITQPFERKIYLAVTRTENVLGTIESVLLHGDVAHHNAFANGKIITALIDWEDCLSGDSVYDIAYYGTGASTHEAWLPSFLEGYQSIRKLPKDFEIRYWLYYLRISLAKAVVRLRYGTSQEERLPPIGKRITDALYMLESVDV